MTTIVTRVGKGSALTIAEMDANFTNLNNAKIEASLIAFTTITTTTPNFTPNALTKKIIVRVRGGGGGGGGVSGYNNPGHLAGLGGHAGACKWGTTTSVSGTYAATIGAGGIANVGGNGAPGGASSFIGTGISITAAGGIGGVYDVYMAEGAAGESADDVGGARQPLANTTGNSATNNSGAGGGGCGPTPSVGTGGSGGSGIIDIWEFNI